MIEIDVNAINIPTHTCLQDCLKNNKHNGAVNIAVTFMCCKFVTCFVDLYIQLTSLSG